MKLVPLQHVGGGGGGLARQSRALVSLLPVTAPLFFVAASHDLRPLLTPFVGLCTLNPQLDPPIVA
jgi:hypothetical protein